MDAKQRYVFKFIKAYPFLRGFTADLLFFIAIDSLFYTVVKGLSPQLIVTMSTLASLCSILLRLVLLKIIKKLGNTLSVRVGLLLFLSSSLLITFGSSYSWVLLGKILYEISFIFKDMEHVMLRNNLSIIGREKDYAVITNNSMIIYAGLTFIVSLSSGFLFNVNPYLPMYFCIAILVVANIVFIFVKDISDNNITETKTTSRKKIKFSKLLTIILIAQAIFYGIIVTSQTNSKLFIQYELASFFDAAKVSTYLSIIVAFSRISRLISAIAFGKLYSKLKSKFVIVLTLMLSLVFMLILGGYFCPFVIPKFLLMSVGFCLILSIRDPFTILCQDVVLKTTSKEENQTAISYVQFSRKIGTTFCGIIVSAILLKWPLLYVLFGLGGLALVELFVGIKLYNMMKTIDY